MATLSQSGHENNGNERILHILTPRLEPHHQMQFKGQDTQICLHTVQWFQVLLFNINNSFQYELFICTQFKWF